MCGIAAFFSNGKRVRAQTLKRATKSLLHRGPDSQGIWLSTDGRVGLGHARLSIIDLATGSQPIANAKPGRSFRSVPSQVYAIESNLWVGNMDWEEFSCGVSKDGVFRGFRK